MTVDMKEFYPDVQIGRKSNGEALYARELLDENERLKKEHNKIWNCPDCGFGMDAIHTDIDSEEYSCPLCAESRLEKQNEQLQADKAAAVEALREIAKYPCHDCKDYKVARAALERLEGGGKE